jgi:zinc protease
MKHLAALAAALLAGSCTPKDPTFTFTYAEKRAKLDNGLRMVIIPDKTSSLVHVDVRYEVGSNEDPPGKAGIAHLVEHMMFQHRMLGPDKPATFDLLPQIALGFNAYTTYDQTHYFLVGPKEDLEPLLKVEAYRMNARCETIPPEQFDREREVVRNEIRQRMGTPEGLIPQIVSQEVYPKGHPYSHMTGGDDHQLASITLKDVCDFLEKYYTPDRATVIVTGNVEPEQTGRMIKGIFGGIARRPAAPRVAVKEVALKYKRVEHALDIERPQVWVLWKLPPRTSKDWTKVQALFSAYAKLAKQADEWEFATDVYVTYWGGALAPTFAIIMELPPGGDVDEALDYLWRRTKTAHWGLKHIDYNRKSKAFIKMGFVESIEGLESRAHTVADEIQFGDGSIAFDSNKEYGMKAYFEIDQLSADGYDDFVKNTLTKDKAAVVVFKPSATGKKGDKRASLKYTAKSHDKQPEPIVDPTEAKRPLPAPKSNSILSKAERYTLGNGMRVILLRTEGMPIVHAELVLDVGAAHEPASKAGLANVAAGYLRPPKDATFTAFASFFGYADRDNTQFVARGLNIYTDVIIKGLERFVKIGEYDQEEGIEKYQKRIKNRYKSADFRRDLAYRLATDAALYGKSHSYVAKGTPTPDSVDNIGYDAAMDWKRTHYTAKNSTLIVVGNFDVKQVKELVADNFGDWDGGRKDEPVPATMSQRSGPLHIGVIGEERPQLAITIAYPSPAGIDGQMAARLVLAEMLNMRMAAIRTELGSTYGTYAGRTRNLGPNAYRMGGTVDAPRAGESLKAMRDKVDGLRRGDDFDKTFALARRAVMKELLADSTHTAALASKLASIAVFDLGPEYYDSLAKYVAAVSPAQVKALIDSELDPRYEVVTCMADRKTLEKAFKEAGLTSVTFEEPK